MIVRDVNGKVSFVSDRYRTSLKRGTVSTTDIVQSANDVPADIFRQLDTDSKPHRKSSPGGLLEGTSLYGQDDDTILEYSKRKKLRRLIFENPFAYSYVLDLPQQAIYTHRPLQIVPVEGQSEDGVQHIKEWISLFEARKGNDTLMRLAIGAAIYNRLTGEVLAEVGMLKNDHLGLIGYPNNEMIGRIWLTSSTLLDDVKYDKSGNVSLLELPDIDGNTKQFTGSELDNFIYFHNLPSNELRGLSRLRPMRRWYNGLDDILELTMEMHLNDARPLEQHIMDDRDMLPDERESMWDDHQENIKDAIEERTRMIQTSDRIKIEYKGLQGRALDSGPTIDKVKGYVHQGSKIPEALVEPKNANKATIDVQERHYHETQLQAIDQATAIRFLREIFRRVLETRGVDPRLTPTVVFPPFTSANLLEQSMTWDTQVNTFGPARRAQIAREQGFDFDEHGLTQQESQDKDTVKSTLMAHNYGV
jgi:hypothetical protein